MIKPIMYAPVFKGIYLSEENFTQNQKRIASEIISNFEQKDSSANNGRTYEQNFENRGIDFVIKPAEDMCSVYLTKTTQLRKYRLDKFTRVPDFYANCTRIGKYNHYDKKFDIDDAGASVESSGLSPEVKLFALMGVIAAIVAMPIISHVRKSIAPRYSNSGYLKADSITDITDTIAKDTISLIKK